MRIVSSLRLLGPCHVKKVNIYLLIPSRRDDLEENIKNKLIFTFFNYDDLKEATTIIVRLLKTSLTTILKRIFEIRNEC